MTQEDKQLLLQDLCARLPYGVKILFQEQVCVIDTIAQDFSLLLKGEDGYVPNIEEGLFVDIKDCKPYLRSMSSMTEEERKEYYETMDKYTHRIYPNSADFSEHTEYSWTTETFDFLIAHHFDYRGLIPKGLAIEVTKENNPYEDINL